MTVQGELLERVEDGRGDVVGGQSWSTSVSREAQRDDRWLRNTMAWRASSSTCVA